ncbi:MAG: hypothetical protein SGJ10_07905 [Bacteroidota bacterium]|nr:hypothetical protein [Bacteroidota bacterium]
MAAIFVNHKDIDSAKWDNCIAQAANTKIYALYSYLNIACQWDAIIYNDYEAVMPLPYKKRLGLTHLYQPFFCQQLGIFHTTGFDTKYYKIFLSLATKQYSYGHLQLNHLNKPDFYRNAISKSYNIKPKTNHILNLANDYDTLYQNYSTKCKQSIKKGQSTQAHITLQKDILIAVDFYAKHYGHRTPHVLTPDFARLAQLLQLPHFQTICYIYTNPETTQIEAACIYILYQNQLYYILGASIGQAKQDCATFYIMDLIAQQYAGKNYILDFEGSMIPTVARFNKGFGAAEQSYCDIRFSSPFSILGRRMLGKEG